jgi:N-acetyl-gamma-glutamyl-phosphate reductase
VTATKTLGLIGARGYTGAELLRLLPAHGGLELALASSRELAGRAVNDVLPDIPLDTRFVDAGPEEVAERGLDVCVLALPNGLAEPFVAAIDQRSPTTVIVDLSADYRFNDNWYYGLPELTRQNAAGQTRIANPGCYATAMQLALAPLRARLKGPAVCMGMSGYSGAGTTPSPKNDPDVLRDNLLPYAPVGHVHEGEVTRQLGHPVRFMPHVASFFRGISMTVCAPLNQALSKSELEQAYRHAYDDEPLVRVQPEIPHVRDNAGLHHATVGGWTPSGAGDYAVVYATLDNLLKGAATQALQNINLALGLSELQGIPHD